MANKRIVDLNPAATLTGGEYIELDQSSTSVKTTLSTVLATVTSSYSLSSLTASYYQNYQVSSSFASSSLSASYFSGSTVTASMIYGINSSSFSEEIYSNVNNFTEINIQNTNSGFTASADLVATNNLGTPYTYYINIGINSSNYTSSNNSISSIGLPSEGYFYFTSSNNAGLYIGNANATGSLYLFAGSNNANTSSFVLTTAGKTGLGTLTPANRSDVVGNISCSIITSSALLLPPSSSAIPIATGSMYISSSLLYVYNGTRWASASLN